MLRIILLAIAIYCIIRFLKRLAFIKFLDLDIMEILKHKDDHKKIDEMIFVKYCEKTFLWLHRFKNLVNRGHLLGVLCLECHTNLSALLQEAIDRTGDKKLRIPTVNLFLISNCLMLLTCSEETELSSSFDELMGQFWELRRFTCYIKKDQSAY